MFLLLAACSAGDGGPPEDSGPAAADEPVDAALAAMPACEPGADDGRFDVEGACADGACIGSTWAEAKDALGRPGCAYVVDGAYCSWNDGLVMAFADADADGTPDDGARAFLLAVNPPWDGGTDDGLALDASLRCFVDALGTPDAVSFGATEDGWVVRTLAWDDRFLNVYDFQDADGAGGPDGLPDFLQFTNYLYY